VFTIQSFEKLCAPSGVSQRWYPRTLPVSTTRFLTHHENVAIMQHESLQLSYRLELVVPVTDTLTALNNVIQV